MILPGTRTVELATIVVPKGFRERKKAAHIPSRMESIKRHGLINLIVIQDRTKKLLAGGDRLTALLALKVKRHEVRVFRGTEQEFEALQLAENIERRHNDDVDAMTKRYVELTATEIEKAEAEKAKLDDALLAAVEANQKCGGTPDVVIHDGVEYRGDAAPTVPVEPRPVGRPKTPKGKAREAVAAATGKTPEAIRQSEKRAAAKEKAAAREAELAARAEDENDGRPLAELPPPVETYELPLLSDEDAQQVRVAQGALEKLEAALAKSEFAFSRAVPDGSLAATICRNITGTLSEFISDVRACYPRAVCPGCKRIPAKLAKCTLCGGAVTVGVSEFLSAPDELRLGGAEAMVSDGKGGFVPYAREAAKGAEPPKASKPAKGARRLTITDEHGQPIPTED